MTREAELHEELRRVLTELGIEQATQKGAAPELDDEERTEWARIVDGYRTGLVVDYVAVAAFETGSDTEYLTAIIRTDGRCMTYRAIGLLKVALVDLGGSDA